MFTYHHKLSPGVMGLEAGVRWDRRYVLLDVGVLIMTDRRKQDPGLLGVAHTDEARAAQRRSVDQAQLTREFAIKAAGLLEALHLEDILLLDMRGLSDVTDYILIASGSSDRQIRSVGDEVQRMGKQMGYVRFGRDADGASNWVVLDFVDVIIHLFDPVTRAHYDLEMLWGDAPQVQWKSGHDGDAVGS